VESKAAARMIPSRHVLIAVAAATLAMLGARTASAQDQQATVEKLVQMNKKALDDYDTLDWDAAKKTLLDALMTGKKAGLDNHPVMARTYVHLGAVYIGLKNRDKAIQSFARAIEIDPAIQLSKGIATAEVNDAFNEAKRKGGGTASGGGESSPPPAKRRRGPAMEGDEPPPARKSAPVASQDDDGREPDLPVRIQALDCPVPDEAILEKAVTLRCALAPALSQVVKVLLNYREPGGEEYVEVVMTKSPKGWYQGKVPKKAVTGKSLAFYFSGQNAAGKTVVENGSKDSPNIMLLMEEESYREYMAKKKKGGGGGEFGEDVENPLDEQEGPYKAKLRLGTTDKAREGLDTRFGNRKWWISIGAGSGFGFAKGDGLEAVNMSPDGQFNRLKNDFAAGGAWAGLGHLVPEVGLHLSPNMALAVQGRIQYIPQPAEFSRYAAKGAYAVMAKFILYTKQARIRFFGAALAGGGEGFRFVVKPVQQVPAGKENLLNFTDTVRGGPGVGGVGAGVYYEIAKSVSVVLEVDGLVGFPIVSVVADVNLSLQFNFYGGGGGDGKIDPNSSAGRKIGEDTE
jgi:hypothetical protein